MTKNIFLLFSIFILSINSYSLPLFIEDKEDIKFITYFYPYVFTLSENDITIVNDEKLYENIRINGKFERKIINFQGSKYYIELFISAFSKVSLDNFRILEDYARSGFKADIINKAKLNNIEEYVKNFKKGYLNSRDYFNKFKNPKETVQKIYSQPFTIPGSPEDSSYKKGELAGKNYFDPYFENMAEFGEHNDKLDDFIKSYAYCLGIISYVKNYYAK
ncbi:MAG: hypothetical protein M0R46_03095 [Candidatus Muirbacterium halophilum]|nr:hypothetical protein [Candidatus Muirbacterium halophilum]MCK9474877.1 hypothetical protein [Candidatus Muirbacterium halophilum]